LSTIHELQQLRKYVKQLPGGDGHIYFEQSTRIFWPRLFTKIKNPGYIHNGTASIYQAYADFFKNGDDVLAPDNFIKKNGSLRVLITPGSRKREKALPADITTLLVKYCEKQGHTVCLAGLQSEIEQYDGRGVKYSDFQELIALIKNADMIISADSLPVHLAQLIKKPHWILYNKRVNNAWLTPFAAAEHYYSTFADWEKLKQII
jgi:ADP-heptose:LPS heptosyltransferase